MATLKPKTKAVQPLPRKSAQQRVNGEDQLVRKLTALSTILQRAGLAARMGRQFAGDRDVYKVLGYPKTDLAWEDFFARYLRQDIAKRIVDMPARATWRNIPNLIEEKEFEEETEFERAWSQLNQRLKIMHRLERVDRLAGIGRYAVLLIGVRGNGSLQTPLKDNSLTGPDDVIYLKPYSEFSAKIDRFIEDRSNPMFGMPEIYKIDLSGALNKTGKAQAMPVHHTRIIHVAEDTLEDNVHGIPRLQSIFNRLLDLDKVVGGGAEMFWQGAYRGLHVDIKPDAALGQLADSELTSLTDEIEEYIHGLRRFIRTQGVDINPIPVELGSPTPTFEAVIQLLAGATGIPKRMLLGSERGELASTQDEQNWVAFIEERRDDYAEPVILRPLIDKLMALGALPKPAIYKVNWGNLFPLSAKDKAQIAESYARAIRFASGRMAEKDQLIVTEQEFRRLFLGLPPKPSKSDQTPKGTPRQGEPAST